MNPSQIQTEGHPEDELAQLSSTVHRLVDEARLGDALEAIRSFVEQVIFNPASTAVVFTSPELDTLCKTVAKAKVATDAGTAAITGAGGVRAGTVILVSELSRAGGHNELIKDILRLELFAAPVRIVQTDCFERQEADVSEAFAAEAGVDVQVAGGRSKEKKFSWLVSFLRETQPETLLLLAHNQDALAVAAAFAALELPMPGKVVYIHHGDHHLSLGASTQDFIHVDPHNIGYFHCRNELGNRCNHYWPMTVAIAPDQYREAPFLATGHLVTCSSGRAEKFAAGSYLHDYFDLIPAILNATGGTHLHIGNLEPARVEQVAQALVQAGIDKARFVHVPWVPSVARALLEHRVDLYISSFPLGGGKATLEAMATGVPLLMHQSYRSRFFGGVDIAYPGAFVWRDPQELLGILSGIDARALADHSTRARSHYERFHQDQALVASCNFDLPQDESVIPPLTEFRPDALANFLEDQRSRKLSRDLEIASLKDALKTYILDISRLNEMIQEKDKLLALTGESVHRLERIVESKDVRLQDVGQQLEISRGLLMGKDPGYAEHAQYMAKIIERLDSAKAELSQMSNATKDLNRRLVELSRYQSLAENLEQKIAQKDIELAELTLKSDKLSEAVESFDFYSAHVDSIEKELAALIVSNEEQRNYFYGEVDKRDKLLKDAQLRYDHLDSKFRDVLEAIAALQQTRWFRLRQILLTRPFGVKDATLAAVTVAGGVIPHRVRSRWSSRLSRAFGLASNVHENRHLDKVSSAYAVKTGAKPPIDAPKIVHALANFMTGGSSRLVVDLVEHLGHNYRHSVLTSFNPDPPAYTGLDVAEYRQPTSVDALVEYFELTKPQLVHVHYWGDCDEPWYAAVFEGARKLGIPVIENINTPVAPYLCDSVQRYVYVSDYVRNVFGKPEAHHVTVYPGSDFQMFTRSSSENAPDDCVGMVYRLENDKLSPEAIQPFIEIAKLRPQTRILIVGGGSLLEPFKASVEAAGAAECFEFTGYVPYEALPEIYRRMSLFIAPIWKESFGQVAPFAMSMKVPVVGYNVGAIGEIIGDSDLLAAPGDAQQLARIAIRLLDSPDERHLIGDFQQERAVKRFSVQAMIERYSGIYSEVTISSKDRS